MTCARFILLWVVFVVLPGQSLFSSDGPGLPVPADFTLFEEDGKVGLKDEQGQILIPAIYEAIGWSDGELTVIDKVVGYRLNGLWGLIQTSNKLVTSAEFLTLKPGEGAYLVGQKRSSLSQRPSFGVVNTSGKVVIPFQYDGLQLKNLRAVLMSRSGTKFQFGLADLSHNILIPLEYQRIYSLGSLRFAVENFENKTAIFAEDGRQLTTFNIDSISSFKKDHAIVYQAQRQGLINRNGQLVLQPTYGEVQLLDDGSIRARESHTWRLLHGDNKAIASYQTDEIIPLSVEHFAIRDNGKLKIIGNDFTPMRKECFSFVSDFRNGLAVFRLAGKTGVISEKGDIRIPARYLDVIPDHDVFRTCLNTGYKNRWVILDASGKEITEKAYEFIAPFNGKFFPVQNRGFWGAVDAAGKEIITCVHDSLMRVNSDNVEVRFKGQYGVINLRENWIVTPQQNPLKLLNDSMYLEMNESTTFLKSLHGSLIYFSENRLEYLDGNLHEYLPSGAYRVIDMQGLIASRSNQPEGTEQVFEEREGFRAIRKDGKFGFIDHAGRLRIANRYEAVKPFSESRAAIRIRNKWGFIDTRERLVVQPIYDHVENFKGGHAIVSQDGHSGIVDAEGKIVLPIRYDEVTRNEHNRFVIRQHDLYGMADHSGTLVIHPRYDTLSDTGNGYVVVTRNGQSGLLTLQGVSTIPMIYDSVIFDPYRKQYMALKKANWKVIEY